MTFHRRAPVLVARWSRKNEIPDLGVIRLVDDGEWVSARNRTESPGPIDLSGWGSGQPGGVVPDPGFLLDGEALTEGFGATPRRWSEVDGAVPGDPENVAPGTGVLLEDERDGDGERGPGRWRRVGNRGEVDRGRGAIGVWKGGWGLAMGEGPGAAGPWPGGAR